LGTVYVRVTLTDWLTCTSRARVGPREHSITFLSARRVEDSSLRHWPFPGIPAFAGIAAFRSAIRRIGSTHAVLAPLIGGKLLVTPVISHFDVSWTIIGAEGGYLYHGQVPGSVVLAIVLVCQNHFMPPKQFSFNARYVLLTYAQCGDLDAWAVNDPLAFLGAECIIGL